MPIDLDIQDHKVLGPLIIEAEQKGRQEGRLEGREGRQEGEIIILQRLIEKRFGDSPSWAREKLVGLSPSQLEDLSDRVLDATSVEELLK